MDPLVGFDAYLTPPLALVVDVADPTVGYGTVVTDPLGFTSLYLTLALPDGSGKDSYSWITAYQFRIGEPGSGLLDAATYDGNLTYSIPFDVGDTANGLCGALREGELDSALAIVSTAPDLELRWATEAEIESVAELAFMGADDVALLRSLQRDS